MLISLAEHGLGLEIGGHCLFAGEERSNHLHRHPDFQEICWVIAGSGAFRHDGQIHELRVGSCFISEPNVVHEIFSKTEDLELFFMTFREAVSLQSVDHEAAKIWETFQASHEIIAYVPNAEMYWQLISSAPHPQRESFLMRALFLESLMALSSTADEKPQQVEDPSQQAMVYIRHHCREAPSVGEIAAAVGLSERQLRRRFQARYNIGLVEAINKARLDHARGLLLMQASISSAARAVGIASPAMFTRLFKQAFGCTPSQWRKQQVPADMLPRTVFGRD